MCLQYAFLPVEAANIDRFFLPAQLEKKNKSRQRIGFEAPASISAWPEDGAVLPEKWAVTSKRIFGGWKSAALGDLSP